MGKRTRKTPAPRAYHDGLIPTTHETYHTYPEVVPDDYDQVKHEKSYPELAPIQLDHQLDPVQLQLAQEHHLQNRQRSLSQGISGSAHGPGDIPHPPLTSSTSHDTTLPPLNRASPGLASLTGTTTAVTNNTTITNTATATTSTSPLAAPPLVHDPHANAHAHAHTFSNGSIPRTSGVHSLRQAWSELDEEEENEHRRQRREQRRHQRRKGLRGQTVGASGATGSGTDLETDDEYDSDGEGDDEDDDQDGAERGVGLTPEERQKRRERMLRRRRREERLRRLGLGGLASLVGGGAAGAGGGGKGEKSGRGRRKGRGKGKPMWKRGLFWVVVILAVIVVALAGVLGAVLSGKIRTAAMDGGSSTPTTLPSSLVTDPVCTDPNATNAQEHNTYTSNATTSSKAFRIQCNADYPGGDGELGLQTNTLDINTMADCLDACARRWDCVGAVFRPKGTMIATESSGDSDVGSAATAAAACWLKATVGVVRTGTLAAGMVSGVLVQ
ncbi:hypothetical protein B0J18DRAFT_275692 [Chaetomium sp. MPI-SDFR-AT-0129]|nr:hypothetical protein B0J18DRAFT_275692 [Chaetomium sp. MPI-SDFR-AT-0129]